MAVFGEPAVFGLRGLMTRRITCKHEMHFEATYMHMSGIYLVGTAETA